MPETQDLEQVERVIVCDESDARAETVRAPEPKPLVSLERESKVIICVEESVAQDA
jgi:hypothetical protein